MWFSAEVMNCAGAEQAGTDVHSRCRCRGQKCRGAGRFICICAEVIVQVQSRLVQSWCRSPPEVIGQVQRYCRVGHWCRGGAD
jgi:hypothetical protein